MHTLQLDFTRGNSCDLGQIFAMRVDHCNRVLMPSPARPGLAWPATARSPHTSMSSSRDPALSKDLRLYVQLAAWQHTIMCACAHCLTVPGWPFRLPEDSAVAKEANSKRTSDEPPPPPLPPLLPWRLGVAPTLSSAERLIVRKMIQRNTCRFPSREASLPSFPILGTSLPHMRQTAFGLTLFKPSQGNSSLIECLAGHAQLGC